MESHFLLDAAKPCATLPASDRWWAATPTSAQAPRTCTHTHTNTHTHTHTHTLIHSLTHTHSRTPTPTRTTRKSQNMRLVIPFCYSVLIPFFLTLTSICSFILTMLICASNFSKCFSTYPSSFFSLEHSGTVTKSIHFIYLYSHIPISLILPFTEFEFSEWMVPFLEFGKSYQLTKILMARHFIFVRWGNDVA